jgi:hypothetical protein
MKTAFLILVLMSLVLQETPAQNLDIKPPDKTGNPKLGSDLNEIAAASMVSGKPSGFQIQGSKVSKLAIHEVSDAETASKQPQSALKVVSTVDDGKVVVIVVPEPGQNSTSIDIDGLVQIGGDLLDQSEHLLEMAIPPGQLNQATTVRGVGYLRRPIVPTRQSVVTEGASTIGATLSQQAGVKGKGVKVAIIDVEFEGALSSYLIGELPNFSFLDLTNSGNFFSGGPHGTACAEIVHDVAPEASLVLLKVSTLLSEQNAVNWCISNGVQIISHSLGFSSSGYGDGKGDASALADWADLNGILFVDAAGNRGDGDVYNGFWTDTDADGWHNFSVGVETIELASISVGDEITVTLVWDDWSIGFNKTVSYNNYDLYLLKADIFGNWSTVASSINTQPYGNPAEKVIYTVASSGTYAVAVRKASSAISKGFRLILDTPDLRKFTAFSSTTSSIIPPSDAYGALSVGAIPWYSNAIENFSSQGPTLDGRVKPDLAAPDEVTTSTYSYGTLGFSGTSAAAPHVAGAAALIKSANPQYTRTQLANALLGSVVDLGTAGKDNVYGYGKLVLSQPATRLVVTQSPSTTVNGLTMGTLSLAAWNDGNVVDVNFNEIVTVSLGSGGGTLSGTTSLRAVNGVATFSNLIYTSTTDAESFTITADDESGIASDLAAVTSSAIVSDVVATRLVFTTQPSGSVSGQPLTAQPVVKALDAQGATDIGFTETVALTAAGGGNLSNGSIVAASGVATFSGVTYIATSDKQSFTLTADDQATVGSDLSSVGSSSLISDVVATKLVFSTTPSGSISGSSLTTQPVISARDANDVVDTDFTETITLSKTGSGTLANNTQAAVSGAATFNNVVYTAAIDNESFTITADDDATAGSDFSAVISGSIASNIVATRLIFSTQPPSAVLPSIGFGNSVAVQAQDTLGGVDVDFAESITLAAVLSSNLSTAASGNLTSNDTGGLTKVASGGVATWTDLKYDASGTIALRANSSSFSTGGGKEGYSSNINIGSFDQDGLLTASATISEPVELASTVATASGALEIFDFTITDGGATDGKSLDVTKVILRLSGSASFEKIVFQLIGPDVTDVTGVYDSSEKTLIFSGIAISIANGSSETYRVKAYYGSNTGLIEGQTVVLSIKGDRDLTTGAIGTQMSSSNTIISNGSGSLIRIDATHLVLVRSPADSRVIDANDEVVGSIDFQVQPLIQAQDAVGNLDIHFVDVVTSTLQTGAGTLLGSVTSTAVGGVATFTNLGYLSASDGESFVLSFDDQATGSGGDLSAVTTTSLSADVVATNLVLFQVPADSRRVDTSDEVVSGLVFQTQPVIRAQNASGQVDADFVDVVTITLQTGAGTLSGSVTSTAVGGVATFTDLSYTSASDGESFVLSFDDQATGSGGDLPATVTTGLSADVVATNLVVSQVPADSRRVDTSDEVVSGLVFQTQPVIRAQNALGQVDADFVDVVTSTLQAGSGTLSGSVTPTAVGGVAAFTDLSYTSTSDGESFVLSFDDQTTGSGGDLPVVVSTSLSADAVATKLIFATNPSPVSVFVNENFGVNGVVVRCLDTDGILDTDYVGLVSVTPVSIGTTTPIGGIFSIKPAQSQNTVNGQAAWSDLTYDSAATFEILASGIGLLSARSQALSVNLKQTNRLPVVANPILPKVMFIGGVGFVQDLTADPSTFQDADGDTLKFKVASSDASVAITSLVGNRIVIDPGVQGAATVTITADDNNGGVVTTTFPVIVTPEQSISHIAEGSLPTIDGDLTEWQTLQGNPQLYQDHFVSVSGDLYGFVPVSDQKVEVWLGWNKTTNLIYIAARVTDNVLGYRSDESNPQLAWRGDNMQVFIDADKSGGTYGETNLQAQRFAISASGVRGPTLLPNGIENPTGVQCVVVRSGNVYSYEWAIPGWKTFNPPNSAIDYVMQPNKAIGLGIVFSDVETQSAADAGSFHAQNSLFGRDPNSSDASQFWSFSLSPPTIQVASATGTGSQVAISLVPTSTEFSASAVSLSFETVANAGATQLTVTGSGPPPPANYAPVGDPLYYDLTTTATHTGNIDLCFDYGGTTLEGKAGLALLHFGQFGWVDITTSRDEVNRRICGRSLGFSTFSILQQTIQTPVLAPFSGTTLNTFIPTLSWSGVSGATSYTIEYANNASFTGSVTVTGLTLTSYTFTGPLTDGSYFWRVTAVGSGGSTSTQSSTDSFVIIPTFTEWTTLFLAMGMIGYVVWYNRRISA